MGCGEEARSRGLSGRHLGWVERRASVPRAKSEPSSPKARSSRILYAVKGPGLTPVQRVFMTDAWQAYLTGELPRRFEPLARITSSYKSGTKGWGYATVTQRTSHARGLQGTQQSQSSLLFGEDQRLNLKHFKGSGLLLGTVSPLAAATKWPTGTSFRSTSGSLRNIPRWLPRALERSEHVGDKHGSVQAQ